MRAGVYKHYKGGYYQVLGVGEHTETKERVVVYVALTGSHMPGPRIRVRPETGREGFFTNAVIENSHGDVMEIARFEYVGDEITK